MAGHTLAPSPDRAELDVAVSTFLRSGIERGEIGCLIAEATTVGRVEGHLTAKGVDVAQAHRDGRLSVIDLEEADAGLSARITPAALERLLLPALAGPRNRSLAVPIRIASELTCRWWTRGERDRALALEATWHAWLRQNEASVWCSCTFDALDPDDDPRQLLSLCRLHGRYHGSTDPARRQAIAHAIDQVLGVRDAVRLHTVLAGAGLPVPAAGFEELALLWLRTEVPHLGHRVLGKAIVALAHGSG